MGVGVLSACANYSIEYINLTPDYRFDIPLLVDLSPNWV